MNGLRPTKAEIYLDNIAYNVKELKKISNSKHFMAVVKADGYGHGAVQVAKTALENGADYLGVASLDEAIELRNSDINAPILVFGYTSPKDGGKLLEYDIMQTVYSFEHAEEFSKKAQETKKVINVHLKIDTGMNRLGFQINDEALAIIKQIFNLKGIKVIGIYTHFADADNRNSNFTNLQFNSFISFVEKIEKECRIELLKHCANSAAIIDHPLTHLDMVRAGIGIYGLYPNLAMQDKVSLKPAMGFKTRVVHLKKIPAGQTISYGRTYSTNDERSIATLPVGYADGYSRLLSNKGKVIIRNSYAPIVGRICMDQLMVDVTNIENVKLDDEVILFGHNQNGKEISVDVIAELLGTINYEIVCMVGKRVPRIYVQGTENKKQEA